MKRELKVEALKARVEKEETKYGIKYTFPCEDIEYEETSRYSYLKDKVEIISRTEDELVDAHLKCKVCMVLIGLSKREKGFTQQEVATLFEHGIVDKQMSSGSYPNYYSKGSRLYHYSVINAIRTKDNVIIANSQDWAQGFASVTYPRYSYMLPLTTIRTRLFMNIENIKVLDQQNGATLFMMDGDYLLHDFDEQEFIAELNEPCLTVKEAYESMKPQQVKDAEANNVTVYRQGDLLFIQSSEIGASMRVEKARYEDRQIPSWGQPKRIVRELIVPEIEIVIPMEKTRHRSSRVGYMGTRTFVKMTVRHPQHRMITLAPKDMWFEVVKNIVKRSVTVGSGGFD